jgi:hypothetical protein
LAIRGWKYAFRNLEISADTAALPPGLDQLGFLVIVILAFIFCFIYWKSSLNQNEMSFIKIELGITGDFT